MSDATSPSSRLGFGTGLPALAHAPNALSLLETALDCGIWHFDAAPLYLWGAAEPLLGQLARRRRAEMVIVSKAGILPPSRLERAANRAMRVLAPNARPARPRAGRFAPAQVRASVEASLRALGTDRIDALLLHEIGADDMSDSLAHELEQLKLSGKALKIGLATSAESASRLIESSPGLFGIVQIPIDELPQLRSDRQARIVHSVLGARLQRTFAKAAFDRSFATRFGEETGVDPHDRAAMGQTLLRAAMAASGVTLFSSTNAATIAANANLTPADPALAARVTALVDEAR